MKADKTDRTKTNALLAFALCGCAAAVLAGVGNTTAQAKAAIRQALEETVAWGDAEAGKPVPRASCSPTPTATPGE